MTVNPPPSTRVNVVSDRIPLGPVVRAPARRDGRRNSGGRILSAVSADGVWAFYVDGSAWSVEHLPSKRVLTHAGTSLDMARSSEGRLLDELELHGVVAA